MIDNAKVNWKTTGAGIGLVVVAIVHWVQTGALSTGDVMAVFAAFGFTVAKDA